jgi:hypothetical protein
VPIHDTSHIGQRSIGHDRTVFIFDPIEQTHDIGAPNVAYLTGAKAGNDETVKDCATVLDRA